MKYINRNFAYMTHTEITNFFMYVNSMYGNDSI